MSLPAGTQGLIGTHYRYPDYFDVGREKVREFAEAIRTITRRTTPRSPPPSSATTPLWRR